MQQFVEGTIGERTFAPGTHTLTWIASANGGGRVSDDFQVYLVYSGQK
jgi:hypothetical protein